MTDRLSFDVDFDLTKAKAEAAAFQKQFDKPLTISFKLDKKQARAEAKALEAELSKFSVKVQAKLDFDEAQAVRDIEGLKRFVETEVGFIDIRADFDAVDLAEEVRAAILLVEKTAPTIKIKVDIDRDADITTAAVNRLRNAIGGGGGGGGGRGVKQELTDLQKIFGDTAGAATKAGGQIVGLGNNFAAFAKPGGPLAAAVLGAGALGAAFAVLPALVATAGGAVATLTGVFAGVGVAAATQAQPVLDALRGIEREGERLAETFDREFATGQAILGLAFEGVGQQIADDLFDPINHGLAQFSAGLAPSIQRSLGTLTPAIQQLSDTLAGPLGSSLGAVTEAFARLVAGLTPILTSGRVERIFDQLAVAVDAAGPGLNETVDLILQVLENFVQVAPTALELSTTILELANAFLRLARPLLVVNEQLLNLINVAAHATPILALLQKLAGARDDLGGGEVFLPVTKGIEDLGGAAGRAGFDVDKITTQLLAFNKKNIGVLAPRIRDVADEIGVLQKEAAAGSLTFDELNGALTRLKAQSGLGEGDFALAFKAWEEGAKGAAQATEDAARAAEQLDKDLVGLNQTLGATFGFQNLVIEQQVFFAEAMRDGTVSAEEFNAVMTVTGLSSDQVLAVFQGMADGVKAVRDALVDTIPTFQSALEEIDLGTVAFGRRVETVQAELRAQLSDTQAFFADIGRALARGADDALTAILTSGATKQQLELLVHELAVGGVNEVAQLERNAEAALAVQQKLQDDAIAKAKEAGGKIPEELLTGLIPGTRKSGEEIAKAAIDASTGSLELLAKKVDDRLLPALDAVDKAVAALDDTSASIDVSLNLQPFFTGGAVLYPLVQAIDDLNPQILVSFDLSLFNEQLSLLDQVLNSLDARTVTVGFSLEGAPREHGGPVLPGVYHPVNERGREGIVDDRGFRMLPAGGYQTFDRPGIIIPANDVALYRQPLTAAAAVMHAVSTHTETTTHNAPEIHVHSPSADPWLVVKKAVRFLP